MKPFCDVILRPLLLATGVKGGTHAGKKVHFSWSQLRKMSTKAGRTLVLVRLAVIFFFGEIGTTFEAGQSLR